MVMERIDSSQSNAPDDMQNIPPVAWQWVTSLT